MGKSESKHSNEKTNSKILALEEEEDQGKSKLMDNEGIPILIMINITNGKKIWSRI